jgi:TetR/AcrR family transcriptional regulator, transcriptional repressor for nem operon
MRVSRKKAAENRERILDAASSLFRAKGFGGIGVAHIMKSAGLTHGGFYAHFGSKDDLIEEACRRSTARAAANWQRIVNEAPDKPHTALLDHYLTASHRDEPGKGCAFAALGADTGRAGPAVRKAYAEGLRPLLDILTNALPGFSKTPRRRKAVAAMATLVGALTLARAVDDEALSNEILEAVRHELRDAAYR